MAEIFSFYQSQDFNNVIHMNDYMWEDQHDFIQYLFPNNEPSANLPDAPVATAEVINAFRYNPLLQEQHRIAFMRFLEHIGLRFYNGEIHVFNPGLVHMRIIRPNHNQLRITRVLRSMRLLGQPALSDMLYVKLLEIVGNVPFSPITMNYWNDAMNI
jgi:hypothetical protein